CAWQRGAGIPNRWVAVLQRRWTCLGLPSIRAAPPSELNTSLISVVHIHHLNCLVDLLGLNLALEPSEAFHSLAIGATCLCEERCRSRVCPAFRHLAAEL